MTDAMLGRPSVAATFVDILRCPLSHSDLHWLADAEIEALNQQVRIGSLRHVEGTLVERALTAAVASPGNEFVYRVDDGIFFLLSNAAIRGGAPAALVTGHGLSPDRKSVV